MNVFAEVMPLWAAITMLAAIVIGLQWADNLPLGATGSFVGLEGWARAPREGASWRVYFLVGTVLGGLAWALAAGRFEPSFANGSFDQRFGPGLGARAATLLGAGALMGYGARLAGGCTSGNGVCGMARRAPASLIATASFMAAACAVANLVVRALEG